MESTFLDLLPCEFVGEGPGLDMLPLLPQSLVEMGLHGCLDSLRVIGFVEVEVLNEVGHGVYSFL